MCRNHGSQDGIEQSYTCSVIIVALGDNSVVDQTVDSSKIGMRQQVKKKGNINGEGYDDEFGERKNEATLASSS
ncbi:CLUMA_CG016082, isoform A [Clunio marinus]|uniref:CLUMA_CG016082, isoform A n=1 Tax=Clunio marinus TaxID=568069 RepID=A0A1J1ISC3_9DIPT|nr:CLUMA_CG016082, isoform A [Clunio marinus]